MRQIVFLGNCQIDTLYLAYRDYVLPYCEDKARYIQVYKKITDEDKSFLLNSDVVVTQNLDTKQEINPEDFIFNRKIFLVTYINLPVVTGLTVDLAIQKVKDTKKILTLSHITLKLVIFILTNSWKKMSLPRSVSSVI